jgi:ADP-ribose pyrophosphatase
VAQGWQILHSRYLYESHWYNVRQDEIRLPHGETIHYTQIEHPGFVTVVPVTDDGQVVLIRSYRYSVDEWTWEVPAGGLGNKPDLPLVEVAASELMEETGAVARDWQFITSYYSGIGSSNVRAHVFLATGVHFVGKQALDQTEVIEVHRMPILDALQFARSGQMQDGQSAMALLFCEPRLRDLVAAS